MSQGIHIRNWMYSELLEMFLSGSWLLGFLSFLKYENLSIFHGYDCDKHMREFTTSVSEEKSWKGLITRIIIWLFTYINDLTNKITDPAKPNWYKYSPSNTYCRRTGLVNSVKHISNLRKKDCMKGTLAVFSNVQNKDGCLIFSPASFRTLSSILKMCWNNFIAACISNDISILLICIHVC